MKLPVGYRYSALYAGIRKTQKDDLALIVSDVPAAAAGVFTQNKAMAAPVILSKENLAASHGTARPSWISRRVSTRSAVESLVGLHTPR